MRNRLFSAFVAAAVLASSPLLRSGQAHAQRAPKTKWDSVAHDLFKELIEINTQGSDGNTITAAQAMAARLKAAGFPDSDVVVLENAPRKGNLVARLRAKNPVRKPLLLLSHIDVVEAKPEDWTLPPYRFTEQDSGFYGRGVSDNKDDTAIDLALIMRLRAENFPLDRDIIVAATTDEEGGGANGVGWLIANHKDLIDAEYGLNEGGGGRVKQGKKLSHDIQLAEKKSLNFKLSSTNPGGHSSRPVKDNAITHLSAALVKVGAFDFPVHLNDVTRAYFTQSAAIVEPDMGAAMKALVANPQDAAAAAVISTDPSYNSQLRTTCVATMLAAGHATNALPQSATANVNCRILPGVSPHSVRDKLAEVFADPKIKVEFVGDATPSKPSPLRPDVMSVVESLTKEMFPGAIVVPVMSTGATDGLYLRNGEVPTYGIDATFGDIDDVRAHGKDERVGVKQFFEGLEFQYRLIKALAK